MKLTTLPSLIDDGRLGNIIMYAYRASKLQEGDFAEFGVFMGGSLELIAGIAKNKTVYGFDSFEGLPKPSEYDTHKEGDFKDVNFDFLLKYFKDKNVVLIKGWSPNIFNPFLLTYKFAFVHIDVDLYNSVMDACNFFYPRMVKGGIMLLDDYGWESTKGAKKAMDEFFADKTPSYKGELKYADGISHKQYLIIS